MFKIVNIIFISTPLAVGHLSCVARGPEFKIPLPRSFVLRPVEYTCQVSSTLAQWSWSIRVLKILTPYGRMTDIWPVLQVISGEMTKNN